MAIDGKYVVRFKTPVGKKEAHFIFSTADGVLSGTSIDGADERPIRDTVMTGNDLQYTFDAKGPVGKMKLKAKATIEGDKISGTFKSFAGTIPFEGERVEG